MISDIDAAAGRLRAVVIELEGTLSAGDVANVWDLIEVGEWALALDTLCTQLYEFDTRLTRQVWSELAQLGLFLGVSRHLWVDLESLVD